MSVEFVVVSQCPLHLALGIALCNGIALVVELFALANAQLHFKPAILEVDLQGDEGIAHLLKL